MHLIASLHRDLERNLGIEVIVQPFGNFQHRPYIIQIDEIGEHHDNDDRYSQRYNSRHNRPVSVAFELGGFGIHHALRRHHKVFDRSRQVIIGCFINAHKPIHIAAPGLRAVVEKIIDYAGILHVGRIDRVKPPQVADGNLGLADGRIELGTSCEQQRIILRTARYHYLQQRRILILHGIEHLLRELHIFQAGIEHVTRRIAQFIQFKIGHQPREKKQQSEREKPKPNFLPDLTGYENLKLLASIENKIGDKEIMDTASKLFNNVNNKVTSIDYGHKKILIVDDNKLNIKVARRALSDFDFEIDECYDGIECLNKVVVGNEYDLILMDIMMPNMSGETAMKKLKENLNFKIPVIALTADAVAGAKEKYVSEGFVDYIAKPFNKEQIKQKLDTVFNVSN